MRVANAGNCETIGRILDETRFCYPVNLFLKLKKGDFVWLQQQFRTINKLYNNHTKDVYVE